jgi:ectoine hydroxylase
MSAASTEIASDDLYPSRYGAERGLSQRRDPILYDAGHRGAAPITSQQAADYERNGFLVLENAFEDAEIELLRGELEHLRRELAGAGEDWVIREPGDSTLRSIFRIHEVSPLFERLAHDRRLVEIAEHVLGDGVYIHQSRLNYKPGFTGKEFYWHSDFETWHVEDGMPRMRALSVSISLTENTPLNGPLMLIPGSHRSFVRCAGTTPEEHFRRSLRKQEYGVPDEDTLRELCRQSGIEPVTGPAGTTVVFDCNTMHGSNGNITPLPRANVFIVYNSVSNTLGAPYGPAKPRPSFLAERRHCNPIAAVGGAPSIRDS